MTSSPRRAGAHAPSLDPKTPRATAGPYPDLDAAAAVGSTTCGVAAAWLARIGRFAPLALLIGALAILGTAPGCGGGGEGGATGGDEDDAGGGKSGGSSAATGDWSKLEDDADELLDECKKVGAAELVGEDFDDAKKRYDDAQELAEDGELKKAESKMKQAIGRLKNVLKAAKEVKEIVASVEENRKAADDARAKADAETAKENAPGIYADAVSAYEKAGATLAKGGETNARNAKRDFQNAADLFGEAAAVASENKIYREQALAEHAVMAKTKEQGQKLEAHTEDPDAWRYGEQAERDAETEIKKGEFQMAVTYYRNAAQQYMAAIQRKAEGEELQNLLAEQAAERAAWEERRKAELAAAGGSPFGRGVDFGGAEVEDIGSGTSSPGTVVVAPVPSPFGAGGLVTTADCFPDDASYTPSDFAQELDAEDEAFLQEYLDKLTPLGASTYDPVTGQISLEYHIGRKVKKEVTDVAVGSDEYIEWEGFQTRSIATDALTSESTWGVGGNTSGQLLFPVPFRYRVKVTYLMNIQVMTGSGTFQVLMNYDPKRKNYLTTDFLKIGRGTQFKQPADKKFQQNANYWADKTRKVPWEVVYTQPNPEAKKGGPTESALFTVTYDVGGDGSYTNGSALNTKSYTRGYVGLRWSEVKFRLYNLTICGILDKELAVAKLREMLKMPKTGGDKPSEDETTDDPTAEGEEVEAVDDI